MWESDELIRAALELGLEAVDKGAEGVFEGQRISLSFEFQSGSTSPTLIRGWLPRPLDLGLEMYRRELNLLDLHPGMTGNGDLDAEFVVRGDEQERVSPLFWRRLSEHLVALNRASQEFRLRDVGCSFFFPVMYAPEQRSSLLEHTFRAAAKTVELLDEARAFVPAPAPFRPHADALQAFAARRGLRWSVTPALAEGRLDERPFQIASRRSGRRAHHLAARLDFATELGLGLSVRRESLLDGLRTALGGQDIVVGEATFDKRFLLRAEPAQASRAALLFDPLVREQLLEIDRGSGPVQIDDRGVLVEPIRADCPPERVVGAIDALIEVAARMERNLLHGGEDRGPYR